MVVGLVFGTDFNTHSALWNIVASPAHRKVHGSVVGCTCLRMYGERLRRARIDRWIQKLTQGG